MSSAGSSSIASTDQAVSFRQLCDLEGLVTPTNDAQITSMLQAGAVLMTPDCALKGKKGKDARAERAYCLLWAREVLNTPDIFLQLPGPLASYIQGLYSVRPDHLSSHKWAASLSALISANMADKGDTPTKVAAAGPVSKRSSRGSTSTSSGVTSAGSLLGAFNAVASSAGTHSAPTLGHAQPPSGGTLSPQSAASPSGIAAGSIQNPFSALHLQTSPFGVPFGTASQQPSAPAPVTYGRPVLHSEDELLAVIPDNIKAVMYLASGWSTEKRAKHDKFVKGRKDNGASEVEDPENPMWTHRLRLTYASSQPADEVDWARHSKLLALIINFDNPDLYRIQSMDDTGDATARQALRKRHEEVERAWREILDEVQHRHALCFTSVSPLFVALLDSLKAKKARLELMLYGAGPAADEILRATDAQVDNVKGFFKFIMPKLEAGARAVLASSRAQYINLRFLKVMRPLVEKMLSVRSPYSEAHDPFANEDTASLAAFGMVPISQAPQNYVPPPAYAPPAAPPLTVQFAHAVMPPPPPRQPFNPAGAQPLPPPPAQAGGSGRSGRGGGGGGLARGAGGSGPGGLAGHGTGGGLGALSFLGRPVSAAVVGRSLAVMDVSQSPQRLLRILCNCNQGSGQVSVSAVVGPHFCFECPVKFWARFGSCPGFNPDGSRIPAAWAGDDITAATKGLWRDLIAAHGLPSAHSARGAEVTFA
jgi:hypothetical protein